MRTRATEDSRDDGAENTGPVSTVSTVSTVDALVVGGGIAGLAAAWELTRAGLRPLLVEARGYTGGLIAAGEVAGVRTDLGAEAFTVRGTAVTSMTEALGLEVAAPSGGGARLLLPPSPEETVDAGDPARGWRLHRFVGDAVLGIPSHPLADDVVSVIGPAAAQRAARDATLGGDVGTGPGDPADVASFVRARMGDAVLERLVGPIVSGIHSADPVTLSVDTVVPGLREATARLGSLQAAVAETLERRRTRPGGRGRGDVTTVGGLWRLTDALRKAIEEAGGTVATRTGAQRLRRADDAGPAPDSPDPAAISAVWEADITPTGRGATPSDEPIPVGPPRTVRTTRVVLACSAHAALRLLDGAGVDTDVTVPVGAPVARLTLVVRAPDLADAPVGSGLLVADAAGATPGTGTSASAAPGTPGPVEAKALSHLSVKWPWIGGELEAVHGPDVHALRLSYGRLGEPRPQVDLGRALADVQLLTGARIDPDDVLDSRLVRWDGTLPPATPAYRKRLGHLRAEVADLPGLVVTGAWVTGTGVAAVVEDARRQAASLRGPTRVTCEMIAAPNHQE